MIGLRAFVMVVASLAAGASVSAETRPAGRPSGRVSIDQAQIAFLASGSFGGGVLRYGGRSYPLKISGLGIGGIGASRLKAAGAVYGLRQLSDFSGAYFELRSGWAFGDKGKGRLWLKNAKGVQLCLEGARKGVQLTFGADGVIIRLE